MSSPVSNIRAWDFFNLNNMRAEDIVDRLNDYIKDVRKSKNINSKDFLVLHRTINQLKPNAYKEYIYRLLYVTNRDSDVILEVNHTDKVTNESEENKMINFLDKEFFINVFNLRETHEWSQIINGVFEGWNIKIG